MMKNYNSREFLIYFIMSFCVDLVDLATDIEPKIYEVNTFRKCDKNHKIS